MTKNHGFKGTPFEVLCMFMFILQGKNESIVSFWFCYGLSIQCVKYLAVTWEFKFCVWRNKSHKSLWQFGVKKSKSGHEWEIDKDDHVKTHILSIKKRYSQY